MSESLGYKDTAMPPGGTAIDASLNSADTVKVGPSGELEGRVLASRYRLERRLGQGGMGEVWLAQHVNLGTPVAIKLVSPHVANDERARSRFLREAKSAASLSSPRVVQIFDYGVDGDTPYIAMELLDGEPLSARLAARGKLSPAETLRFISDTCRAIAKAHDARIIHRDLKPDNIFVVEQEDEERAKVLDFGIAKGFANDTMTANTQSGAVLGTPYYMSPEQAQDAANVDHRTDLWAVGVIAYQCLLGKRPFVADSLPGLSVKIIADPIPVPSEQGDVPPGFDGWFARAVERDVDRRFQSAREMSEALAAVLGDGISSVTDPSLSLAVPATNSARGIGPRVAGAAAGLAIVAGLGIWAVQGQDTPPGNASTATVAAPDARLTPDTRAAAPGPNGAEPEPAMPPPPDPATSVTITLEDAPDDATVHLGPEQLGLARDPVRIPYGEDIIYLRIEAAGYDTTELPVYPTEDRTLSARLEKPKKKPKKGKKTGKSSTPPPSGGNPADIER